MEISVKKHEYPLAAEYRRSAYYVAALLVVSPFILGPLERIYNSPNEMVCPGWELLLILPGMLSYSLGRHLFLGVDEQGLHWRWLFFQWRWPWEEFRNGHVHLLLSGKCFRNSGKHFWNRDFSVEYAGEECGLTILSLCMPYWKEPVPELPESGLVIWPVISGKRRRVVFTDEGIEISGKKHTCAYRWNDVQHLSFLCRYRMQQCCAPIHIQFPGFLLELPGAIRENDASYSRTWRRFSPLTAYGWIVNHVPEEKIDRSPADYFSQLEASLEDNSIQKKLTGWMTPVFAVSLIIYLLISILNSGIFRELRESPPVLKYFYVFTLILIFSGLLLWAFVPFVTKKELKKKIEHNKQEAREWEKNRQRQ